MTFDADDIRSVDPSFRSRASRSTSPPSSASPPSLMTLRKDRAGAGRALVLDRPGVSVALWGAKRPDQLDAVAV